MAWVTPRKACACRGTFATGNYCSRVIVEDIGHSEDTGARPTLLENHLDGTYLLHIAEPGPMRWLTMNSLRDTDANTCYPNMEKLVARFAERAVVWPHLALYSVRIP